MGAAAAIPGEGQRLAELEAQLQTEQKRHQEEIKQFAYAVSHDLREPIRMIVSYSQLLERRCREQLEGEAVDFMVEIAEAAHRMDRMLSDLLTYSHQFRNPEPPATPLPAEGALQGALLTLDKEIRESGAVITHDTLPAVSMDFAQLNQLFLQLISNAIKFRGSEPLKIHISAADSNGTAQFSIRDNGSGIDPRYQEQIFGVFKRLHGREFPGTGMGLAICKKILEQHGGRIWVESEPQQGTTFYFTIPE
jgi:hypothetical protein